MLEILTKYLEIPELDKTSETNFWNDEHISKELLKAHLTPNFDGASRSFSYMDDSVNWIKKIAPVNKFATLLDIGCGPGLYAERFHTCGYDVTGIDFSKRSIVNTDLVQFCRTIRESSQN